LLPISCFIIVGGDVVAAALAAALYFVLCYLLKIKKMEDSLEKSIRRT